jgi:hypothetical protein
MEPVILSAKVLTEEELSDLKARTGAARVSHQPRHIQNFNLDLHRWAMSGTNLPQDDELRMKFEAVLETHQQVRSNVPRSERKKCKEEREETDVHFLSPSFRETWRINGLPVIGIALADAEERDDEVALCRFEWREPPPWPVS